MLTSKPKRGRGRPSLGDAARTHTISIKLSEKEYNAIATAVRRSTTKKTTVSSWIRDHALKPLGKS
jgi:hypothetical protein